MVRFVSVLVFAVVKKNASMATSVVKRFRQQRIKGCVGAVRPDQEAEKSLVPAVLGLVILSTKFMVDLS